MIKRDAILVGLIILWTIVYNVVLSVKNAKIKELEQTIERLEKGE